MVFGKSGKKKGGAIPKRLMWVADDFHKVMKDLSVRQNKDIIDLTAELARPKDKAESEALFEPIMKNWRRIL